MFPTEIKAKDIQHPGNRPKVVCLCGSTRFWPDMHKAMHNETLAGNIVLPVGNHHYSDVDMGVTDEQKLIFEALHRHKIDIADEILVVNRDEYIGESTRKEIVYAHKTGKAVRYLFEMRQMIDE